MQQTVFSRRGMDRVMRFAFELARKRERQHVTSCTKSNAIAYTMPHWDERFAEISAAYPDIRTSQFHIDALTGELVSQPDLFDVIVASTLFGEILSRVGSACVGPIGIAPSANLNPDRNVPSCFEPVHGSAPDIFGRGIANPIGQIWSGAMMLEHLGHTDAAAAVVKAIETVIAAGPLTADLGGKAYTFEVGTAIAEAL
jgi:tartrate dehydrogenase/decarboxylase/D-malate dehydrogenase